MSTEQVLSDKFRSEIHVRNFL